MAFLRTTSLTRIFKMGGETIRAVDDVSVEIEQGAVTALVGPSGSGKTTLLNLLGGLDRPTAGEIYLDDIAYSTLSAGDLALLRRRSIGYVFQAYNLIPVLTAAENVGYVMMLQGAATRERDARVEEVLGLVGLAGYGHRRPDEMSGGQQQRVAVARAIAARPRVVFADEPTANLDSKTGEALTDLFLEINGAEGTTFVFSTHDPVVMRRARRVLVLHDGRIVGDGAPEIALAAPSAE
ncbi:MAG: ABC transporter ATP-binding protein [Myxococcales bacterium]|nr:ABC transporter ATP-binding protein [Myxococcales bacterium]